MSIRYYFVIVTIVLASCCGFCSCSETNKSAHNTIAHSHYKLRRIKTIFTNRNDTVLVDLRELLKIDYDSLFIFCEYTPDSQIASVLNQQYISPNRLKYIPDSYSRIILLKADSIVYQRNYSNDTYRFDKMTDRLDSNALSCCIHYSPYYLVKKKKREPYILFSPYQYVFTHVNDGN